MYDTLIKKIKDVYNYNIVYKNYTKNFYITNINANILNKINNTNLNKNNYPFKFSSKRTFFGNSIVKSKKWIFFKTK